MSSHRWVGKTLGGRYEIEELLGQGGMSAVYKAVDPNLNRPVAIKLIHPHLADVEEFVHRFREEANMVGQLRHPNIVQVFDFNQDGDDFYMVMEFVAGETLRDRITRLKEAGSEIPLVEVIKSAINICDAADFAHRRNLIHRDIKPANIMMDLQDQAILMDFGVAKIIGGPQYTATGATVGTALYMSPEQIRGERIDDRSDIYAIGVVLFEMLCGRPPFQAESPMTVLMMHLTDPVPDMSQFRPDLSGNLKQVVEMAMAKDRTQRYADAAGMSAALRQVLTHLKASLGAPTAVGAAANAATVSPRLIEGLAGEASHPATSQSPASTVSTPSQSSSQTGDTAAPEVVSGGRAKKGVLITGCLLLVGALAIVTLFVVVMVLRDRTGDEDGLAAAATRLIDTTPDETATAQLLAAVTQIPTEEPIPPAPSELAETPAPTNTPEPSPTAAPRQLGLMSFLDNEQSKGGSIQLTIAGVGPPPDGSHYALWLSDGLSSKFLGAIEPGNGVELTSDSDENLLARFDRAFITVESDDTDETTPTGDPVFIGLGPFSSLEQIRLLFVSSPETPQEKSYLFGAIEQTQIAIEHGGFLAESLAINDLSTAKQHSEHIVNILAGEENSLFGDLDGDGLAQNPGDGFGLISYLEQTKEQTRLAAEVEGAGAEVRLNAETTIPAVDSALEFLNEVIQAAGRVLASDSASEAQPAAEILHGWLDALLNGLDDDGDGIIDPIPGEAGILKAYEQALKMSSFVFFKSEDVTLGNE